MSKSIVSAEAILQKKIQEFSDKVELAAIYNEDYNGGKYLCVNESVVLTAMIAYASQFKESADDAEQRGEDGSQINCKLKIRQAGRDYMDKDRCRRNSWDFIVGGEWALENIVSPLQAELQQARQEIDRLKTVMIAAAEEIQAHWEAHCDSDGYGPANLMHRLEKGIPEQYGYTAGAFTKLNNQQQPTEVERMKEALDACFGVMMQPYLYKDNPEDLDFKVGIGINKPLWIEARRDAEKLYYEAQKPLDSPPNTQADEDVRDEPKLSCGVCGTPVVYNNIVGVICPNCNKSFPPLSTQPTPKEEDVEKMAEEQTEILKWGKFEGGIAEHTAIKKAFLAGYNAAKTNK
jgi:hypothetical protein